ncbi:MAG: hypothetical protein ABSA17_01630 [Rhabdochlamydiaceae bacterium]|jgi:hypothetical protein
MLAVTKVLDTYVAPWEGAVRAYSAGLVITSFFYRQPVPGTNAPPTVIFKVFSAITGCFFTFKEAHRLKIFDQSRLKPLYYAVIGVSFLSTAVVFSAYKPDPPLIVRICQYPAKCTPYLALISRIAFTIFEFRSRLKEAFLPFLLGGVVACLVSIKIIPSDHRIYKIFYDCRLGVLLYCGGTFEKAYIITAIAEKYFFWPKEDRRPKTNK